MQKYWTLLCVLFIISCKSKSDYTDQVNPFIGTGGYGWSEGRCYPGATVPYGMVQLSPENRDDLWTGYYRYDQPTIKGFSHTHISGAGISEGADITIAPTVGEIRFVPGDPNKANSGYRSRYTKTTEQAQPGYYTVFLDDYGIKAELTATSRTGMHRYTFPESKQSNLIVDLRYGVKDDWVLDSWIKIIDKYHIGGFRRTNRWAGDQRQYFVAEFSKAMDSVAIVSDSVMNWNIKEAKGGNLQAVIRYQTKSNEQIGVKVALSAVSMESALENLSKENNDWDFDKIKQKAATTWEKNLSKIEIEGQVDSLKQIFYTAYYHTLLGPTVYSDVNGNYLGSDYQIHNVGKGKDYYTLFSLWDTYRTLHPLMTILEPKRVNDIINTFVQMYSQSGLLPVWNVYSSETWCMMGYHAVSVIADAYVKGIRDYDEDKALEACKKMANLDYLGLEYYKPLGYIPSNKTRWSVSKVLEYAYDDYCIAQLSQAMGRNSDFEEFGKRSLSYKNLFNPENKFLMPKNNTGEWNKSFNPNGWSNDYCEAGAYHYRFYVPHDLTSLISLYGGEENFVSALDSIFIKKAYEQSNEPSHHMPFLYNYAGTPWKTQEQVREILLSCYNTTPEGLCGNDDVGQMSAWYVMAALGLYPVCPGNPEYILTSPLFDKATIHLENGKRFVISTENQSLENKYIQSVTLNGTPYTLSYITHKDIIAGGELHFVLSNVPNKSWGTKVSDRPTSRVNLEVTERPNIIVENEHGLGTKKIRIESTTPKSSIYYTTDGSEPNEHSILYTHPFQVEENSTIKAQCVKVGLQPSLVTTRKISIKKAEYPKIIENSSVPKYHDLTAEGGAYNLIDGNCGTTETYGGYWVFLENKDLDVTVDRGSDLPLKEISTHFLHQPNSGSFAPKEVQYLISNDGKHFTLVEKHCYDFQSNKNKLSNIITFSTKIEPKNIRYVKVKALNAKGNMLIDEIIIH